MARKTKYTFKMSLCCFSSSLTIMCSPTFANRKYCKFNTKEKSRKHTQKARLQVFQFKDNSNGDKKRTMETYMRE